MTCYLCAPEDPTADEEACDDCDREFWDNPVFVYVEDVSQELIERLVAINLQPGDVVWMQTPEARSPREMERAASVLKAAFPDHKVIVTPPGYDISAFREVDQ